MTAPVTTNGSSSTFGTGAIIDSQEDVGGYPDHAETTHSMDAPDDGQGKWLSQWVRSDEH